MENENQENSEITSEQTEAEQQVNSEIVSEQTETEQQVNSAIVSEKTETLQKTNNSIQAKKKFKVDKKHIQGFIAGVLIAIILYTGISAAFNPEFLSGTFTKKVGEVALQEEIDMLDVTASPASFKAGTAVNTSFILDIPPEKLDKVKKDDFYLWGYFNGLEVTKVSEENGKLKVNVEGTPLVTDAYDSDTNNNDGYISLFGEAVKDEKTGYTATVSVTYPRFTSLPEKLEANTSYDTDITLTLTGDTFVNTPTPEDITLNGAFKDMELSNVLLNGNVLSFHVKGSSNLGHNGHIEISKNVLSSGLTAEKIIPVEGVPMLYSITPITVEAPFEDTLVLRISNDFFTETLTADMFTLGGGLINAFVSKIEYIDNMTAYITLCGNEISNVGSGTITLSSEGLQSGRTVTTEIQIKTPSISMKNGGDEILAAVNGTEKEYKLTVFSEGNDFMPYLSEADFVLKGALSTMQVKKVNRINGYKTELTLKGAPTAGSGVISVRSAALGGITGAECNVDVIETADFYGLVNLSSGLPGMTVSFCDKDGNALDIPTATTAEDGGFIVTVTSDMPIDAIAYIKAKNEKMELRAPFHWEDRQDISINAFTTLMQDTIAKTATEKAGIQAVYNYLELANNGMTSANYKLLGKNAIFSHTLFESQANGDVDGYIRQLEDEIEAGTTRSFAETAELTGETGGFWKDLFDWGLGKIKDAAVDAITSAITEGAEAGVLYLLREAGILGPDTEEMLEELQASVNALSDQVKNMQELLTQEIREAELQGMLNNLNTHLNTISSLSRKYNGRKALIMNEVATYKTNHPDSSQPVVLSELPASVSFFGPTGEVAKADLYDCITNIVNILNAPHFGKPLISVYYTVLKGKLPFEHNAGLELYNFIKCVTAIETTGLQLYSAYCLFNGDPNLEADLNTLTDIYEESIDAQVEGVDGRPALLPSINIFNIEDVNGENTVTARCNYNGKYYTVSNNNRVIKEDVIRHPKAGYYVNQRTNVTAQDYEELFQYWELYYSKNMTPKAYLTTYSGFQNLPDWFIYDYGTEFVWYPHVIFDRRLTFYDISDNVYRTDNASNIYNKYPDWYAKEISVSNT